MKWSAAAGRVWSLFTGSLEPLSKLAQVVAVVIAGIWTYHLRESTGEAELNPELWVSAESVAYDHDLRLLIVRIREKNVGKVPISLSADALSLSVKRIPEGLKQGFLDMDKQPPVFNRKRLLKQYEEGDYLGVGAEFEDVAELLVTPGLYHIEGILDLPDRDYVNDVAVVRVE
jgi:hypothetical protein